MNSSRSEPPTPLAFCLLAFFSSSSFANTKSLICFAHPLSSLPLDTNCLITEKAAFAAANSANTYFFLLLLPALDRAIAIACFWGLPLLISVLMLAEIVLLDLPLLSGILFLSYWFTVRCYL